MGQTNVQNGRVHRVHWGGRVAEEAARNGHAKDVWWLLVHAPAPRAMGKIMTSAIGSGELPLIELLMRNGFDPLFHGRPDINTAANSGSLTIVKWMYAHGFAKYDDDIITEAATSGYTDMVSWFLEHRLGCDVYGAFDNAITGINPELDTAKYLDEHFDLMDCKRFLEESMMYATESDTINAVQWLIEKYLNDPDIDLFRSICDDIDNVMDAAAQYGNFDTVKYLHDVDFEMKREKWKRKRDSKRQSEEVRGEVEE